MVVFMAATTSFLQKPPPHNGFVSMTYSKLGCNLDTRNVCGIKKKYASSSLGLQVKANANDGSEVNATTIGVMDWSMFIAAITTIFLEHEMMFHSKKEDGDMASDVGLGRMVQEGLVFRQTFYIRLFETGPDRTPFIETLVNYLQETAINHSKTLGLLGDGLGSTPEMSKKNLIWVVTKMQIVVDRYPTCGDVIQIDTWRVVTGKNSARSDWLFRDCQTSEILIRASSNWAIMNKETRRLSKFPDEVRAELEKYFVDRPPIIEENTKNYPKQDTPIVHVVNGLTARWKDLDMNQHVNNVKYIRWILESVPETIGENYELVNMTLEYRRECRKDSVLKSQTSVLGNNNGGIVDDDNNHVDCQHVLQFEGGSSGVIVKGRTRWRPKCTNKVKTSEL